ncbi:unnamed protein product [Rotaria magnacalcarata]|uniref:Uncharacterized protein n=1 Tax=Rotaria magnacalcarata TaxID=392030 RepID=A0A816VJI7_9BILA|nr:unnamed protein product [Rotaria magnacalcarata]
MNTTSTDIFTNNKLEFYHIKFVILLILQIPSITLSIIIFIFFITHRAALRTPQNHDKLCRIVTDNASNNIKAFEDLIIPGFDSYFYGDDENNNGSHLSDCNDSGDDLSDNLTISITNSIEVGLDIVKDSFDNLASSSKLRLPCFAHTLQLVVKDGLAEAMCIKQAITKVSKIVKIAHSSATFAEKLEAIGPSIPTANKTRWNSQLYTVQKRLEIQSSQLNLMLIELKRKDTLLMRQHRASMSQTTLQMLTMLKCNSHLL